MKHKKSLPFPDDPKAFALWIKDQDILADAQIALHQSRPIKEALSKNTYA